MSFNNETVSRLLSASKICFGSTGTTFVRDSSPAKYVSFKIMVNFLGFILSMSNDWIFSKKVLYPRVGKKGLKTNFSVAS